jgi:hypothetical protein
MFDWVAKFLSFVVAVLVSYAKGRTDAELDGLKGVLDASEKANDARSRADAASRGDGLREDDGYRRD